MNLNLEKSRELALQLLLEGKEIEVSHNGKTYQSRVCGRKLEYPTVYIWEIDVGFQFSWQTILDCLRRGEVLIADRPRAPKHK